MSEWKEYKLGEVAEIVGGGTPKTKESNYWNGEIPWLTPRDLSNFNSRYISKGERNISKLGLAKSSAKILPKGAVLLSSRAPVGYLAIALNEISTNQGFRSLIPNSKTDSLFLYYLLKNNVNYLKSQATGTTFGELAGSTLKSLSFLFPPLPEQRAIASVLSSLDDKIDLLHRQNKTLEAMAETLFRQWFVEEADEGWDSVRVGDFVHINVSSINKNNALKTIRYLDTGSLTEGKIKGYQTFDIADAPSRARRIVKHNDVLISTVRPNQKHYGILKNPAEDVIVSTGFCVITCDKINPHFIYILLTTDEMTEYLHSIAEGSTSTYPSLKPSDIEGLEFQMPPLEKLDTFSEYADNVWNKIEYNHTQIRTLEKLRDMLLPKLMSGEMRLEYRVDE